MLYLKCYTCLPTWINYAGNWYVLWKGNLFGLLCLFPVTYDLLDKATSFISISHCCSYFSSIYLNNFLNTVYPHLLCPPCRLLLIPLIISLFITFSKLYGICIHRELHWIHTARLWGIRMYHMIYEHHIKMDSTDLNCHMDFLTFPLFQLNTVVPAFGDPGRERLLCADTLSMSRHISRLNYLWSAATCLTRTRTVIYWLSAPAITDSANKRHVFGGHFNQKSLARTQTCDRQISQSSVLSAGDYDNACIH